VLLFTYGFFAIAKSNGNRVKRVLEERINPKDNVVGPDTTYNRRSTHMTLAQIEDGIRSLKPAERIELYKWLDHVVVADCRVETSFCSRLGVERALEIRRAIDQKNEDYRPERYHEHHNEFVRIDPLTIETGP
jgi:hypothetical protein